MKKASLLLLSTALCLCSCWESKKPQTSTGTMEESPADSVATKAEVMQREDHKLVRTQNGIEPVQTVKTAGRPQAVETPEGEPDIMAEFPGGELSMELYFKSKLKSRSAKKAYATVELTLSKEGKVEQYKIKRTDKPARNAEVLKAVSELPAFKPATKQGKPVASRRLISVPL